MDLIKAVRLTGILLLTGMLAGIFSVAPAIDSTNYLTEAAIAPYRVIMAAIFQFIMSLAYIGIAILLYPILKRFDSGLSIGFLSFRIIAVSLSIVGTVLLLSLLALSEELVKDPAQSILTIKALGSVLKISRDYINHVFMILILCTGNFLFYILLLNAKLIPQWLSVWGILGALLSAIASVLVLFRVVDIITPEYLVLNAPTALQDLVLGVWLILKGFNQGIVQKPYYGTL